jgi:ATP-binding cassette, subfamily C, bacterial CydD
MRLLKFSREDSFSDIGDPVLTYSNQAARRSEDLTTGLGSKKMKTDVFRQVIHSRIAFTFTITCGILMTIVMIAQMTFLSSIVNRVFIFHAGLDTLGPLLALLIAAILLRAALVWAREVTAQEGAIRVKSELRRRLFAHLLQLGPAYSKGESTGELVTTLNEGVERLDAYVSHYLPQIVLSVVVPLLIVAYIFPVDWLSAILLLVTGPVIPLLMFLVGSYAEKHVQRQWLALSRLSAHFLDVVQGLPTLKLFGRSAGAQERIERSSASLREKTLKMLRIAFLSGMVLEFMTAAAIGLIAVTLGVRLINGGIAFVNAFLVLLLAPEFYRPLRELGVQRHAGMEGKEAARRISEILQTPPPLNVQAAAPGSPLGNSLTLAFKDVTYSYPGAGQAALNQINLTLLPQTCTALVGRSGAGKSTLVNLLLRFMDVDQGEITVNAIPINQLEVEAWREYIGLVPQKPYLFYGSVLANIRLARPAASDEDVARAAKLAGVAEFIERLPRGYASEIGERGVRLSAGQAQRLALARAFLKNAPLLILDEPTSSLDPESEALIRDALQQLMRNRTVLVIAHRYHTIANAQQVVVLEAGRVIELGELAALLTADGAFARLMSRQRKTQVAL